MNCFTTTALVVMQLIWARALRFGCKRNVRVNGFRLRNVEVTLLHSQHHIPDSIAVKPINACNSDDGDGKYNACRLYRMTDNALERSAAIIGHTSPAHGEHRRQQHPLRFKRF